ncbi:MAG: hypothetical protein ACLFU8_09525 [Anaerolineales bacterium]
MTKGILLFAAASVLLSGAVDPNTTGDDRALTGVASQYGQGRMMSNVRVRQLGRTARSLPTPLPEADVYFAALDCRDIGKWFKIRRVGADEKGQPYPWESAYATDCAGLHDGGLGFMLWNRHTPMTQRQADLWLERVHRGQYKPVYVAEVDYPTAVRWGTVGRGQPVELIKVHDAPHGVE